MNNIDPMAIMAEFQERLDGSPAHIKKEHIDIKFQSGAIGEFKKNGCDLNDVIMIVIDRLKGFQNGDLACRDNDRAINALNVSLTYLKDRRHLRVSQGVIGKSSPHAED